MEHRLPRPTVRLLPWAPQYGTSMLADVDAPAPRVEVDTAVEHGRWQAVVPAAERPHAVQLVDGVRRVEAHAFADAPSPVGASDGEYPGVPLFGLFGSFAVGAVRCEDGHAWFIEDAFRLERRYFQAGGDARDHVLTVGGSALRFAAEQRPEASANGLIDALNRSMLDAEGALAESLALDESALTLVDGPLRHVRSGRRLAGYVKRVVHWYVSPHEQRLLLTLRAGERTPLFRLSDPEDPAAPGRLCWYVRIAELPVNYHPLSGVMRLETSGGLPLGQAVVLADQATGALPRLASSLARDPRAPQNLVPVGALETLLTHRLGDREWVRRALTAHLALGTAPGAAAGLATPTPPRKAVATEVLA